MLKGKKAEMGIGTLIIFIAMILVAAIAAAVLIQTATSLQNKALLTGDRSRSQISTSLRTLLLYAENGEDQDVEYFCQKLKLAPGSDPIKFSDALIEFDLVNGSVDLIKGEDVGEVTNDSWVSLTSDLNGDGYTDYVRLGNAAADGVTNIDNDRINNITFNISNSTTGYFLAASINLTSQSGHMLNFSNTSNDEIQLLHYDINATVGTTRYGTLSVVGNKGSTARTLQKSLPILVTATSSNVGAYSVDYLIKGSSYVDGYLQRGDVVKVCYAAPRSVSEDEDITIHVIPKVGNAHVIEAALPDIMTDHKVYVYP